MSPLRHIAALGGLLALTGCAYIALRPVDLSGWQQDGAGIWAVIATDTGNDSVVQSNNDNPGVFFDPAAGGGDRLYHIKIRVDDGSDDDFIGFVLGYQAGELTGEREGAAPDFLLIDWKRADQDYMDLGVARAGLAVSRVSAPLRESPGAWAHDPADGVQELARAQNLGRTGWQPGRDYVFEIRYDSNSLSIKVDGQEELALSGDFPAGALGFYNYSQPAVTYSGVAAQKVPFLPWWLIAMLLVAALLALGAALRGTSRRRAKRP